jgi:hypothetical protein
VIAPDCLSAYDALRASLRTAAGFAADGLVTGNITTPFRRRHLVKTRGPSGWFAVQDPVSPQRAKGEQSLGEEAAYMNRARARCRRPARVSA